MKAYTYVTATHNKLLDQWLLPSLPSDLDLSVVRCKQTCHSGNYQSKGWSQAMFEKASITIRALQETWESSFLMLDADIQFFGPVSAIIDNHLEQYDIVAQNDAPSASPEFYCAGFMACRSNQPVKNFWSDVLDYMKANPSLDDQQAFNILAKNSSLKIGILPPDQFWSPRKRWRAGNSLDPPESILMHHANWTVGVPNKLEQLTQVRELVNKRKSIQPA